MNHLKTPAIVWFRNDLRLADNPALAAASRHQSIVAVFIWSPTEEGHWTPGGASRWWLERALTSLQVQLKDMGNTLLIMSGESGKILLDLAAKFGAKHIYWNRRYEPAIVVRDHGIKKDLMASGLNVETFNGSLIHEPWEVLKKDGTPYQIYTAYWNAGIKNCTVRKLIQMAPIPRAPQMSGESLNIADLTLGPKVHWDMGLQRLWQPGEISAARLLQDFVEHRLPKYQETRDIPGQMGTSLLSAHLHFGHISPQQLWHAVIEKHGHISSLDAHAKQFLKELIWRDFAANLIFYFPHTDRKPLRGQFANFPWRKSKSHLQAWQSGQTGFPIVDAGMRQLWSCGWMHNRVRMVVASFLVKDLRINWQEGAKWFWDTLVDANLASNTMGWQWAGGCGADAAPYFRIFNPMLQGARFDPEGLYIRTWIPELENLPNRWIHQPWEAPKCVLEEAGVVLGKNYPKPIVDHSLAKIEALLAYDTIKSKKISGMTPRTDHDGI